MKMRIRRMVLGSLMVLASIAGIAVTNANPAGAAWSSIRTDTTNNCGLAPVSPNSVEVCSTWVPSGRAPGVYVYKMDATHHYGWWGSTFDPGTWHVNVYAYHANGTLIGLILTFDVGDHTFPIVNVDAWGYSYVFLGGYNEYPHQNQHHPHYRPCVPGDASPQYTWFADVRGSGWGLNQWYETWPHSQVSGGSVCQHGFGYAHGGWTGIPAFQSEGYWLY